MCIVNNVFKAIHKHERNHVRVLKCSFRYQQPMSYGDAYLHVGIAHAGKVACMCDNSALCFCAGSDPHQSSDKTQQRDKRARPAPMMKDMQYQWTWAARYTGRLIHLTPVGIIFSFIFFSVSVRDAVHSTDSRGLRWSLAVSGRGASLWVAGRARSCRRKTINHALTIQLRGKLVTISTGPMHMCDEPWPTAMDQCKFTV